MKRILALTLAILLTAPALLRAAGSSPQPKKPNVVVILMDDVGFGDLGMTGCKDVATPHIDAVAAHGIRFTHGYVSASICSPSRAGLLTGRYQERWGHDGNECEELPTTEVTLADRMKQLGYSTGMVGKWHLGNSRGLLPTMRGFDEVFSPNGNAAYFGARILDSRRSRTSLQPPADKLLYTTELNSARAAEFIGQHRHHPFFLYVAFNNVHGPLEVPQKYIDRITSPMANPDRRKMAAMVSAMDDAVGVVMEALRKSGLEENTLVFLLNDNGSYDHLVRAGVCHSSPFRGGKSTLWEGGIRVPFVMQWKGRYPNPLTFAQPVVSLDIVPTSVAAAGGTVQTAWKLDGVNLLPYLDGAISEAPHPVLYWRMGEKCAVREGDWKMSIQGPPGSDPKPRLFNVVKDEAEHRDLASAHPERVERMLADWKRWNAQLPPPRPGKEPSKETGKEPSKETGKGHSKEE
jgi:arylsulfatase A-like enzyme